MVMPNDLVEHVDACPDWVSTAEVINGDLEQGVPCMQCQAFMALVSILNVAHELLGEVVNLEKDQLATFGHGGLTSMFIEWFPLEQGRPPE